VGGTTLRWQRLSASVVVWQLLKICSEFWWPSSRKCCKLQSQQHLSVKKGPTLQPTSYTLWKSSQYII